jgi:hypothetical protein
VVQVTATASNGYSFVNWTGDAAGSANPLNLTLDTNKNITANFVTNAPPPPVTNTLTVISAHGTPVPSGTTSYTNGSMIGVSIGGSPVDQLTTQLVATGWTVSGNSPVSGSATNFDLTLTNNATLTWLWQTNVLLQGVGRKRLAQQHRRLVRAGRKRDRDGCSEQRLLLRGLERRCRGRHERRGDDHDHGPHAQHRGELRHQRPLGR